MRFGKLLFTGLFLVLFVAGCGGGGGEESTATPAGEGGGSAPAAKTVDPATAGTVKGKVTFSGETERGARIRMNADPSCHAQHSDAVYAEEIKIQDGMLQDTFVWVKSGLEEYQFDTPAEPAVLDQKGCIYTPHVFGVQTRQEIHIKNSDPTTHNINPAPANNRDWNRSQAPNQAALVESFARQEIMIPVKCNVHPWMKSYIGVVAHPYFAVTGSDGTFELKGLPPGDYTVEAWHEKLGTKEMQVTLGANETKEVDFGFGG